MSTPKLDNSRNYDYNVSTRSTPAIVRNEKRILVNNTTDHLQKTSFLLIRKITGIFLSLRNEAWRIDATLSGGQSNLKRGLIMTT